MANSLVQDLTKRVFSSLADLTGVRLWSGKTGESNALGLEVSEILSSAVVSDASVDYKGLTPKGFNASVATTSRRGIGTLAIDAEVTAKSGTDLLVASDQVYMQAQWNKDWFEKNGIPSIFAADSLTAPNSMKFDVCFSNTISQSTSARINPTIPANRRFKGIYFTWMVGISGISGASALLNSGSGVLNYTGGTVSYSLYSLIGGTDLDLRLSADGREISIYAPNTLGASGVQANISINAVLEAF